MKNIKFLLLVALTAVIIYSCSSDDDGNEVFVRDAGEVYQENLAELNAFLQTHFYNQEEFANTPAGEDFRIQFDTIAGANADRTPLSEQVTTRTLRRNDIDYTIFVLNVRQGTGDRQATFADSTLVSYRGTLLNGQEFDNSNNSIWFNLPGTIDGFAEGITGFNDATDIIPNPDGTISYRNGGIGAIFMPSGVAYFNRPPTFSIPEYASLIFTFQLRRVKVTDHDGDGILSIYEDLDQDKDLNSPDGDDDTDDDGVPNYVESDDDGDGIPTSEEDADPNGDGNPDDALDTDGDGIPDYLDDRTEN